MHRTSGVRSTGDMHRTSGLRSTGGVPAALADPHSRAAASMLKETRGNVPFCIDELLNDRPRLDAVVDACARSMAHLAAARATTIVVKGRESRDSRGVPQFHPFFTDHQISNVSTGSCGGCHAVLSNGHVLCRACAGAPVRLRPGPTLLQEAHFGGHPDHRNKTKAQIDEMVSLGTIIEFARKAQLLGSMLSSVAAIAKVDPDVRLLDCRVDEFESFTKSYPRPYQIDALGRELTKAIHKRVLPWVREIDARLMKAIPPHIASCSSLQSSSNRDEIIKSHDELAWLLATDIVCGPDDTARRLEALVHEQLARCNPSSNAIRSSDVDVLESLAEVCAHPDEDHITVGKMHPFIGFFLSAVECPPELSARVAGRDIASLTCDELADTVQKAIADIGALTPFDFETFVSVSPARGEAGELPLPPPSWCREQQRWRVERLTAERVPFDGFGVRIVRLACAIRSLSIGGVFLHGVVDAQLVRRCAIEHIKQGVLTTEFTKKLLLPYLLDASLRQAEFNVAKTEPMVEDEVREAIAAFSRFSLSEICTIASPSSPLHQRFEMAIAERTMQLTADSAKPNKTFRCFVNIIGPLSLGHLAEARQRRRWTVHHRPSELADRLFAISPLAALAERAFAGRAACVEEFPLTQFTRTQSRALQELADKRHIVRKKRRGNKNVWEISIRDLLVALYS